MNLLRRTASNIMILMSGQIVTWVSTLILAAAYGRFLGATGFGELYLATTFTALIGFPIEFSFNQQIVRDVVREPQHAHRYITMSLALKAVLWAALYGFALILSVLLGYAPEVRWLIAISGLMLVSSAIGSSLIAVQTAYMQVGMAKFGSVIEKVIDAALAIYLLRSGHGVIPVALVLLFGSIAGMAWQIVRTMRMIGIRIEWDVPVARTLIRSGMSFLAYGVIGVIYYRVDTILLSVFATAAAIGVYGAAYRLFDTLTFIPGIVVGAVMSPILAKYAVDTDKGKLRLAVEKSTTMMLLCSAPAAAGLLVVAPNIIGFVYQRQDFSASEGVLQALAIGLIALYLNSVLTTVLVSTGQERKLPIMAIAALIFNVALNLVLIPRFMDMGAAWATSLTEVLLLGIGLIMIDRSLIPVQLWATTGKIIVATLVMAVVAHVLDTHNILFIIPVAAVIYGVAVLALRVLPDEDIAQVKSLFARYIPGRSAAMESGQALAQTSPELAIAGLSERVSASSDRPTTGEQVALAGAGHLTTAADGAELARSAAQAERSPSISVPLNYPVRIPSGLVFPLLHPDGAPTSVAQRRMQRRLASLDAHQIAAALAQRQLGHLALSMRRIELAPATATTTGQRLTGGRELAAIRLDGAAIQPRDIGGAPTTPAYCLAIHRQRPQKPTKDNRGHRGRHGKPATVSNAGYVGRSSRPLVTLDPATLRSLQSFPAGQAEAVSKRRGRASGAPVAASDQSGDRGDVFARQSLELELAGAQRSGA